MTDHILQGVELGGHGAFTEPQRMCFEKRLHVLAGPNASGKSTALGALDVLVNAWAGDRKPWLPAALGIAVEATSVLDHLDREAAALLDESVRDGLLWCSYVYDAELSCWRTAEPVAGRDPSGRTPGSCGAEALAGAFESAQCVLRRLVPPVTVVRARRALTEESTQEGILEEGYGLLERLAELADPAIQEGLHFDYPGQRAQFVEEQRAGLTLIREGLRWVLGDATADLSWTRAGLSLTAAGWTGEIETHSDGVLQLVTLVAATVDTSDGAGSRILCIDEPDAHLHPQAARRLMELLSDRTGQSIIATHAAAIIDSDLASVTDLRRTPNGVRCRPVSQPSEHANLVRSLGNRPSDLVQADTVVWVEGPSDVVYVSRWLKHVAPDIVRGQDYTIMFYGGALLSYTSVFDVSSLVRLVELGWRLAVVVDSDISDPDDDGIGPAKEQIRNALEVEHGLYWQTGGYTVENYVPRELFAAAVGRAHPKAEYEWNGDQHSNPLAPTCFPKRKTAVDKTAIAFEADVHPKSCPYGLLDDVMRLATFILEGSRRHELLLARRGA